MAWKATGAPAVRKQGGRWVVRIDGSTPRPGASDRASWGPTTAAAPPSKRAASPWMVAVANNGKLAMCTASQARLESRRRSSEVISTASKR
jgi:hypothetical protein